MSIDTISLSLKPARVCPILWFVFSVALLLNVAVTPVAASVVARARSDLNGDGVVNMFDLSIMTVAFGSYPGHAQWDSRADVSDDGLVDMFDLLLVVNDYDARAYTAVGGFWSSDSYWHMKIKENPKIHPNSAQMIDWLINDPNGGSEGAGGNVYINWKAWTCPIYESTPDTPRVTVYKDDGVTVGYNNVPIEDSWGPCAEKDALMGIIDWENRYFFEFYHMRYEGGRWLADAEYRYDLDGSGLFGVGGYSVGGSSTPFLACIIRDEEIEAGVINHPIGCCMHLNKKDTFVWPPAGRSDGKGTATYAIPMGARIQLDPSVDLDAYDLNPTAKIIAKALQDYGCVLKESGGGWFLYAEHDLSANWDSNMGNGILKNLPNDKWRVIDFTTYPPEDDLSEFELP